MMADWSPAENAYLTERWTDNWTAVRVADGLQSEFGREFSRDMVIGRVRRLGLIRRDRPDLFQKPVKPPKEPKGIWHRAGRLDRLTVLWIDGMPIRQMASVLSDEFSVPVSSSAVIGKVHRLGLHKKYPREHASSQPTIARRPAATKAKKPVEIPPSEALALADVTNARPWQERGRNQCAFPLGERGSILSCCAPTDETYCIAHRQAMGGKRKAWVSTDHIRMARAA